MISHAILSVFFYIIPDIEVVPSILYHSSFSSSVNSLLVLLSILLDTSEFCSIVSIFL